MGESGVGNSTGVASASRCSQEVATGCIHCTSLLAYTGALVIGKIMVPMPMPMPMLTAKAKPTVACIMVL